MWADAGPRGAAQCSDPTAVRNERSKLQEERCPNEGADEGRRRKPWKRLADMTPEEMEKARAKRAEHRRKYKQSAKGKASINRQNKKYFEKNRERMRARMNETARIRYAKDPEKAKARRKRHQENSPETYKATSSKKDRRKQWRRASPSAAGLLRELSKRAPNYGCREDIIATSALFVIEGDRVYDALKKATKAVLKDENFIQYSVVPIEDCFWLRAEDFEDLAVEDGWL